MLVKGSFLSRIINRFWVKSAVIPQNPLAELKLDISRPIVYVLDQNSASDLLALQKICSQSGLPDPYQTMQLHGIELPLVIYLHDWYFFNKSSLKREQSVYLDRYQQLLSLHQEHADVDVQLIPVTFFWGRNPGKQSPRKAFLGHSNPSCLQKSWAIFTAGKDHLVRFNAPISVRALVDKNKNSKNFNQNGLNMC